MKERWERVEACRTPAEEKAKEEAWGEVVADTALKGIWPGQRRESPQARATHQ